MQIMMELGVRLDYDDYLLLSKEYIDSQQHPVKVLEEPRLPEESRRLTRGFVQADCLYGFACNPCSFACPHGAITKTSTSTVPVIDYDKCIGLYGMRLSVSRNWLFSVMIYEKTIFLTD